MIPQATGTVGLEWPLLCLDTELLTAAGGKGLFEGTMPAALLSPLAA